MYGYTFICWQDMAAHSACDFGGGRAERRALARYRSDVWQGRVSNARLSDRELHDLGKCPMTPEEVGIMLAALGFGPQTHVYLASYTVSSSGLSMWEVCYKSISLFEVCFISQVLYPWSNSVSWYFGACLGALHTRA